MSSVVSGIGNAVSGVVKGVGDAVSGAVKGVGSLAKQIYDSKIGKAIIIAGAIYFGGAALAGGFGSSAAGGSFLSGMGAGVSSAATSLTSAWGSVLSADFATAAGTIGNSWGTAYGAGVKLAAPAVVETAATALSSAQAPMTAQYSSAAPTAAAPPPVGTAGLPAGSPINSAAAGSYTPVAQTAAGAGAPAATQPWYAQALDYITPKSELAQYGLISGATTIGGNIIAGIGQQQALEDERKYQEQQRQAALDLRNANVGAELFVPGQYATAPGPAPAPAGLARRYMPQSATA
jgi:hypothetical protein